MGLLEKATRYREMMGLDTPLQTTEPLSTNDTTQQIPEPMIKQNTRINFPV